MPAVNMSQLIVVPSNPTAGKTVIMSPFSGPKGSPFDAKSFHPTTQLKVADPTNHSTGALNTGIGFGCNHIVDPTAPASIKAAGFTDDYTPGVTMPAGTAATTAILTAIGGGRSLATTNGFTIPDPFLVQPLLAFGEDGPRDAGAGPAFTGFAHKMVTATGTVALDGAIEAGFLNRNTVAMTTGQSAFGNSTTASAAVT